MFLSCKVNVRSFTVDLNVDNYDGLQISNHGRTLTVSDLVKHQKDEFLCKVINLDL